MIDTSDPLERLRAANPVPPAEVARLRPDPALFGRITAARPVPDAHRPRRRRAWRLVPALVVTSLVGGAAAYGWLRGDVSRPETVACFEAADPASATEVAGVEAAGPVEACAALWRRGAFGGGTEVPPLVACVLPTGVAGVFPATAGADVCTALNLVPITPTQPAPPATAGPGPVPTAPAPAADLNTRIVSFRDAVLGQFVDAGCMPPATGEEIVRRELDRAGLEDWTVLSTGYTAERPCATLFLHPDQRQVVLVPGTARR
jgi:hypothetical protein